ncbi:hypothetical protein PLESTB_001309400 [Pleodorina starrii]|uniref:Uncharacterized protein n=1 Tax=Pleodorina starrii TaxID=330485 RepID=A0A9W6F6Z2_9CHLO|nr:hypothetical protein PLESTM_001022200 [Pleodorina starrii]GLC58021.1 hypothetical protein PLESTB_001309400 [Pleodorina starrii]GLC69588.1 hypothetical protein PLESTF_000851700 [Pleodorina starrii]
MHRYVGPGRSVKPSLPAAVGLGGLASTLPAASAALVLITSPAVAQTSGSSQVSLHFDSSDDGRLLPCPPRTSCVSTANFMSPSQYLAPWSFDPLEPAQAKRLLVDEIRTRGGTVVQEDEARGYIAAVVPYQLGPGRQDEDVLEFKFTSDGSAVAFRSEARTNTPPPPFCWTPGCISGPGNRGRMEALRDALGWSSQETDEDKKWVQILLHD